MEKELLYFVECPVRNRCPTLHNGDCNRCEECLAPIGFVKGGDKSCHFCDECLEDELS